MMSEAKIDNIEVFSLCVAAIMDALYDSFPLPSGIDVPSFFSSYDAYEIINRKQPIQLGDEQYAKFFDDGFPEIAGADIISGFKFDENIKCIKGEPYFHFTAEEITEIRNRMELYSAAFEILQETIKFLEREGYIKETKKAEDKRNAEKFTLTSKGFAHLNRVFQNKTIKSNFHTVLLTNAEKYLSAGTATVKFGLTLKGAIVALLAGN